MGFQRLAAAAVILCLGLTARPAHADDTATTEPDKQNELSLSYGVITLQDFVVLFEVIAEDVTGAIINGIIMREGGSGVTYTRTTTGTYGAIGAGYNHYLSPRWSVGALFNYEGFTRTLNFSNGDTAQARDDFFALMARTDFRWVNAHSLQLYSGIGLGASYIHSYEVHGSDSKSTLSWSGQINLLGIRVGHNFGAFAELGFGWNGLLAAGLSGKF
jgi:hypothetical protein